MLSASVAGILPLVLLEPLNFFRLSPGPVLNFTNEAAEGPQKPRRPSNLRRSAETPGGLQTEAASTAGRFEAASGGAGQLRAGLAPNRAQCRIRVWGPISKNPVGSTTKSTKMFSLSSHNLLQIFLFDTQCYSRKN